ncbi:DUF4920 domain-containing protein [Maribacter sp. CXY002]|uniref:DUF4920 domain-containing protein n=1 Tax=Maribacter luteocoastalis TaxID=3407671 RepID=UPI003B6810F0
MGSEKNNYMSIGDKIDTKKALGNAAMLEKYLIMSATDTLLTKFAGTVKEVCKVKGCWMILELYNNEEVMVRFKDYAFFMPTDIQGKDVIVNGVAFVEEMSIEDQRHFAKDGGANVDDINKILKPKKTFGFEASGVLIKQ